MAAAPPTGVRKRRFPVVAALDLLGLKDVATVVLVVPPVGDRLVAAVLLGQARLEAVAAIAAPARVGVEAPVVTPRVADVEARDEVTVLRNERPKRPVARIHRLLR